MHSTSAAPDSVPTDTAWFPLPFAARLELPLEWEHLGATLLAGAPCGAEDEIVMFGRRGGPDVLDSELARLGHLAALAVSIAAAR